ncbi:metalloregulator ArsR/SmtB family transcription factor [Chitinispirillales bacterium ANBcel5]|uniref:ArsR/SmtB family transcription factor n=1 Tax=Cellulosispirillum alkaliphilum TaxID=3039283 RepID=UPI002A54175C|nr:metalloregulator ArsR/SmtB family transcription factor [Chitinispirillales bacterium ANBcel5]
MNTNVVSSYTAKAAVLKAMAHPTRLFIIEQLSENEHCVCQLTAMIGADTSTVSKHLSVLKNAGIVKDQKRGLMVFYSLKVPCVLKFMGCIESVLQENLKEQLCSVAPNH